jgi:hypothetical protein
LKAEHLNRKPPSMTMTNPATLPLMQKQKPQPAAPRPTTPEKRPQEPPLPPAASAPRRPLICRECGAREEWPGAGMYMLRRRILKNSVAPEILNATERKNWANQTEQSMGIFCGLQCLEKSLTRLKALDEMFRQRGTGTRLLEQEVPSALTPASAE